MTIDDCPDARCVGCGEEGQWCYVTGAGYACSTCRRRAEEEEREERDDLIEGNDDDGT